MGCGYSFERLISFLLDVYSGVGLLGHVVVLVFFFFFVFCLFVFLGAAPVAYGNSQARDLIRAAAAGLHHSHSNTGFEPQMQPTPQLTAMSDPSLTERGQGSNPQPHGY